MNKKSFEMNKNIVYYESRKASLNVTKKYIYYHEMILLSIANDINNFNKRLM